MISLDKKWMEKEKKKYPLVALLLSTSPISSSDFNRALTSAVGSGSLGVVTSLSAGTQGFRGFNVSSVLAVLVSEFFRLFKKIKRMISRKAKISETIIGKRKKNWLVQTHYEGRT